MMPLFAQLNFDADSWWLQAMINGCSLRCAAAMVVSLAGVLIGGRGVVPLFGNHFKAIRGKNDNPQTDARSVQSTGLIRDANGTATLEFVLVFPIVLFLALLLIQTTLLMVGNLFVHYAAFAATRTAIVQIPQDYHDFNEPPNTIVHVEGQPKYDLIRQAAAYALMPVSGRLEIASAPGEAYANALHRYYADQGQTTSAWVDELVDDRLKYASHPVNTNIVVARVKKFNEDLIWTDLRPAEMYTFGPKDPISVRVEHRFNLSIPYVRAVFTNGSHRITGGHGMYSRISAQYTLTNKGISNQLPPRPELHRIP